MHRYEPYRPRVAALGDIIARNVRAERGRRGWKQSELAERLGWSPGNVGHLESGRRSVKASDIPALCRAFDIYLDQLFFGADPDDLRAMGLRVPERPAR